MVHILIASVLAYLVGAIPTGYLVARFVAGVDIRQQGSGNTGASNVARVVGKKYFILVFFIDAVKAFSFLRGAHFLLGDGASYYLAAALLVGNSFSVFLQFTGGKGVATTFGLLCYFLPWLQSVVFAALWLAVLALSKQPFLASFISMSAITGFNWYLIGLQKPLYFLFFLCSWMVFRHTSNILSYFYHKHS